LETKNFFIVAEPIRDFEGNIVAWAILGKRNSLIKEIIFNNVKTLIFQISLMIFIDILTLLAIFYVVSNFITKPILSLEESLESFFAFLKDPKKKINLPDINSKDEIGEMSRMIRDNIEVASYLHAEMANLLSLVDRNIIILEIDENKRVKRVSEAFKRLNLDEKEVIEKIDWESLYKKEFWDGEIKVGDKYLFVKVHKKCINEVDCGYTLIGYDITDKKRLHELTLTLEERVKEKTKEVYIERELLKEAHKKINDSIKFASLIQQAILPKEEELKRFFKDYFILWKPRDIVGGDAYFFEKIDEERALLMVIDCTGHGVPGAFITMIVKAIEKEIVSKKIYTPSEILTQFHDSLKRLLQSNEVGFDGAVVYIDKKENILKFSASNSTLFYYDNGEVKTVRGSRVSVGYKRRGKYKDTVIGLGKSFYITTDGFIDQIGGDKNLPFGKSRFIEIIKENVDLPMSLQKKIFEEVLEEYKKENQQIDDITVIGFKI
jgi:serine phosphatase RsbU (regulator of sigma subunit)